MTILLVDDDPLMHRMLVPRLKSLDVQPPVEEVISALSPGEALEALARLTTGPLAVLSDFNLKADMTGLQLLRTVRKQRRDAVRVLFSGYAQDQLGDVLGEGDAHVFVEKPMRVDDMLPPIIATIRRHLSDHPAA